MNHLMIVGRGILTPTITLNELQQQQAYYINVGVGTPRPTKRTSSRSQRPRWECIYTYCMRGESEMKHSHEGHQPRSQNDIC